MIPTIAIVLAIVLQADAPAAADVPAADIERVAAAVERAMPSGRRLEGLVTRRIWMCKEGQPPPDPARDAPGMTDESLVRLLGPDWAVVTTSAHGVIQVLVDGHTYQVALGEPSTHVQKGVRDPGGVGLALLLQVDRFAPIEIDRPLAGVIRAARPLSLRIDGTIATFRFVDTGQEEAIAKSLEREALEGKARTGPRPKPWPHEITVDLAEPPRVLGYATDIPRNGPDKPLVRDAWVVEAWQQVDGAMIGQRIRHSTSLREGQPYTQITELTRVSVIPEAANDAAPRHPLPEGLVISDDHLTFTVGSPDVVFDGRSVRLKEPLWLYPGARLEALLRDAGDG
ncbi:MAG: hypothetical protein U0575_00610 [Phycisphaerales bacterium]